MALHCTLQQRLHYCPFRSVFSIFDCQVIIPNLRCIIWQIWLEKLDWAQSLLLHLSSSICPYFGLTGKDKDAFDESERAVGGEHFPTVDNDTVSPLRLLHWPDLTWSDLIEGLETSMQLDQYRFVCWDIGRNQSTHHDTPLLLGFEAICSSFYPEFGVGSNDQIVENKLIVFCGLRIGHKLPTSAWYWNFFIPAEIQGAAIDGM